MTFRRFFIRAGGVMVLAVALGGPTPGYVGSCDYAAAAVSPGEFCSNSELYKCARNYAAGRLMPAGYQMCMGAIAMRCNGYNFAAGCSPSESTVNACYTALRDPSRLSTLDANIVECQPSTICPVAMLEGI